MTKQLIRVKQSIVLLNNRGLGLLVTFLFMVTLTVIVSSYLYFVQSHVKISGIRTHDVKALYLAEAGLNKAVWYLENTAPDNTTDGSWRTAGYPANPGAGGSDPKQESLGSGTYTMWVENVSPNVQITARGTVHNVERFIRQDVSVATGGGAEVIVSSVAETWREI